MWNENRHRIFKNNTSGAHQRQSSRPHNGCYRRFFGKNISDQMIQLEAADFVFRSDKIEAIKIARHKISMKATTKIKFYKGYVPYYARACGNGQLLPNSHRNQLQQLQHQIPLFRNVTISGWDKADIQEDSLSLTNSSCSFDDGGLYLVGLISGDIA